MLLKLSWLLCKVLVLRIKCKKGKDFLLLKDFYYFIILIPPVFFCWKMPYLFLPAECFCADTVLSTWTKAANCTSGWANVCLLQERWDTQVLVRGSVELIYGTTDDAMNCFYGPSLFSAQFLLTPTARTFLKCCVRY